MLVLPLLRGRIGAMPVRADAPPMTWAAAADVLSLLLASLAFAWIVGGSACSDVPEPTVSGLARQ